MNDVFEVMSRDETMSYLGQITNYSILLYNGSDDGATPNDTAWGSAKYNSRKGNGTTDQQIVYFPNNSNGNAVYYFNSTPNMDYVYIMADKGVKLSFPSTNGVSFKKAIFVNDIQIISRDRNNTGYQFATNYSKVLYSSLSENDLEIGAKTPRFMSDSEFYKNAYTTNGAALASVSLPFFDSARNLYKVGDTAQGTNNGKLNVIEFPFKIGYLYTSLVSMLVPEPSTSSRYGVLFSQDNANFLYYSIDIQGYLYKGICNGGTWTETNTSKYSGSSLLTPAYNLTRPLVFGARAINPYTLEIYLNGILIDTVTGLSFNAMKMGFGINTVNASGSGILNLVWGQVTETPVQKMNISDTINAAVFGDSITFGEGSFSWAEFLPNILEGYRGITKFNVDNQAVSGQTSSQQLSIMNSYNFTGKDIVLILIGTNDIQGQTAIATFQSNLQNMISAAQTKGAKVVIGIPPMFISQQLTGIGFADSNFDYGAQYRTMIMQVVAQSNNVFLADTFSEIGRIGTDNALTTLRDNLHPNMFGEVLLARAFARSIIKALTNDVIILSNSSYIPLSLQNGWVNFGSGYSNAQVWKDGSGVVHVTGVIKSGTYTGGTLIAPLPTNFLPASKKIKVAASSAGSYSLEINNTGLTISIAPSSAPTWISIDCEFRLD